MRRRTPDKTHRARQPQPPGPTGAAAPARPPAPPPAPATSRPTRAWDAPEPEMHPAAIVEPAEDTELRVNRVWLGLVVAMLGA